MMVISFRTWRYYQIVVVHLCFYCQKFSFIADTSAEHIIQEIGNSISTAVFICFVQFKGFLSYFLF